MPTDPKELEPALFAKLERLHRLYEVDRPEALLHAMDFFLRHYAPGSWMTEAYAQRLGAWSRWNPPDLAEAFGVKRDSKKVPEARRRQDLRWPIVSAIVEYRRQKISAEEAIERTAKDFKMSVSFVAKLYRNSPEIRKLVENLPTLHFRLVENQPALHSRRRKSKTS